MDGACGTRTMNPATRLARPFHFLWHYRNLLWATALNDVRSRVAGSVLGLAWVLGYPLLLLGVYSIVYFHVFKAAGAALGSSETASLSAAEYVVYIFCGLVPFLGFSEALTSGVTSVTGNAHLIKNTLFPIELVPVKTVLAAQFTQGSCLILLLLASIIQGNCSLWSVLVLPIWFCQFVLLIGLVWIVSCVNIVLRDLQQLISIILLCLMLISPIAITMEGLPQVLQVLNPLYHIILCLREVVLFARPPAAGNMFALLGMAGLSFFAGYWTIGRTKLLFSDNL